MKKLRSAHWTLNELNLQLCCTCRFWNPNENDSSFGKCTYRRRTRDVREYDERCDDWSTNQTGGR